MSDSMFFLHRLTFARGSDALDFVRTLRERSASSGVELAAGGPIVIYGARIVAPDAPAELYLSVGALSLAYALGMEALGKRASPRSEDSGLPADMALLFTSAIPAPRPQLP